MTRYTMSARSQGKLYTQRETARMERDDGLAPEVEQTVRKRLFQRLDGFYCDLQAMCAPPLPDEASVKAKGAIDDRNVHSTGGA